MKRAAACRSSRAAKIRSRSTLWNWRKSISRTSLMVSNPVTSGCSPDSPKRLLEVRSSNDLPHQGAARCGKGESIRNGAATVTGLTQQQQAAVSSDATRILVSAGAGSGKTHVLVERYIACLLRNPNLSVHGLIAVTYPRVKPPMKCASV